MAIKDEISARLNQNFAPELLEVKDESHLHAGHAGHDGSGESHFHIRIRAPIFAPLSRLERHRLVLKALGDIPNRIHALGLDIG